MSVIVLIDDGQFDFVLIPADPTAPTDPARLRELAETRVAADFHVAATDPAFVWSQLRGTRCAVDQSEHLARTAARDFLLARINYGRKPNPSNDVHFHGQTWTVWRPIGGGLHQVHGYLGRRVNDVVVPWAYPLVDDGQTVGTALLCASATLKTVESIPD